MVAEPVVLVAPPEYPDEALAGEEEECAGPVDEGPDEPRDPEARPPDAPPELPRPVVPEERWACAEKTNMRLATDNRKSSFAAFMDASLPRPIHPAYRNAGFKGSLWVELDRAA